MASAQVLSVTKEGMPILYDGMHVKRGKPGPTDYILLSAGKTATAEIDLSSAYCINATGQYTVQMETLLHYHPEGEYTDRQQPLESTFVTFQVHHGNNPRMTIGEHYRLKAAVAQMSSEASASAQQGQPLDPQFVGGTVEQRNLTKKIHRASYHYTVAALEDIEDNQSHYVTWFGALIEERVRKVKQTFSRIKRTLEEDTYTYHFDDPRCQPEDFGFSSYGSRDIYLCDKYTEAEDILGVDTKLCTLIHQLGVARAKRVDEIKHGRQECLDLAATSREAITNADNYGYFVETLNVFDYGFDSMESLPNGHTYVTRGNVYIRYSDDTASNIDSGHPRLITTDDWGIDMPDRFLAGFDSMIELRNKRRYVTNDNEYVRFAYDSDIDLGYPLPLEEYWSTTLPVQFTQGFDAMTVLPNDKTYVTKDNQYIRYSDINAQNEDPGYPLPLQGNWGNLTADFAEGFDTMAVLGNGKIYVTRFHPVNRLHVVWCTQK